jgi:outer membrane protein assembly factor BamB
MFSRNVKSLGLVRQVTSSFNSQMIAVVAGGKIVIVDLSAVSHSLLSVTAAFWNSTCFGCEDSCIVALSWDDGSQAVGAYRIADSVTLFRVPLRFDEIDSGGLLFATASKIYLTVQDGDLRNIVYVFDYATGVQLQQSIVYDYPVAQLYVQEPEMILM